jgi:HEAT repeat protein
MGQLVLVIAVLLPIMLAGAFLLGRFFQRRQQRPDELSAVTRQHIDLFQGGQLSEEAIESAKVRLRNMLEHGQLEAAEASLRPGTQFVVQVRALTELGTDDAGKILEHQLRRRHTDDQLEQSWYWIDIANGLRNLNRTQSLPHLLRCAERAGDIPLGHFLAAETVCFLGFAGYLREIETPLGRAAIRVLHRALEGLRCGVQPQIVIECRLGEMIEVLWDHRPDAMNPLVVRIFLEALRVLRRAPHAEVLISSEMAEQEAFNWQISRLAALAPALTEYLQEIRDALPGLLVRVPEARHREYLMALIDLRCDAAPALLPLIDRPGYPFADAAVEALSWSKNESVPGILMGWVKRRIPMKQRAAQRPRVLSPRRLSIPPDLPYRRILHALRRHPSAEVESFLCLAARDWDPGVRAAALSSLGWWEPVERAAVLALLQQSRRDANPEVRHAARAALARLGERLALQWFRQGLVSEDNVKLHEAIQNIAIEGLTLLWPELDRLAESEDLEIAHHAREALERMSEDMDGLLS